MDIVQQIKFSRQMIDVYQTLFNKEDRTMMLFQRRQIIATSSSDESTLQNPFSRSVFYEDHVAEREVFAQQLRQILRTYQGRKLDHKERRVLYGVK